MASARPSAVGVLSLALALAGCGVFEGAGGARKERNFIGPAEVAEAVTAENAYLLVQRLRPVWLNERGPKSVLFDPGIVAYEGDMVLGGVETLRLIPAVHVHALRFLTPERATFLHGAGHPHGAIVVVTKSEP